MATNAHVIDSHLIDDMTVRFPTAPKDQAGPFAVDQVVYFDQARDIAFLKVACPNAPLVIAPVGPFRRGMDITVIGNPGMGALIIESAVSKGILSAVTTIDHQTYYQLSVSINPGNSGGPVLDPAGRVLGIATLKAADKEGLGFCIPTEDLRAAVEKVRGQTERDGLEAAVRHREYVHASTPDFLRKRLGNTSPAVSLASFDAKRLLPATDPAVRHIQTQLILLQRTFTEVPEATLADHVYDMVRILHQVERNATCASTLDALAAIIPPRCPRIHSLEDYESIARAYLAARINGNLDEEEAITLVQRKLAPICR